MTLKEMNLRVFRGEAVPQVFFQPRFEPWFEWHRLFGSLPPYLKNLELRQAYDMLGASMRTVDYYTGQPSPIDATFTDEVKFTERREGDLMKRRFTTPHGDLFDTHELTVDQTWRMVEFPAKGAGDLPALRWLLERRVIRFNATSFKVGAAYIGERGVPQFWVPKSPYFSLAQQWFRYEDFIYALMDCPAEMEELMGIIDGSYDELYRQLTAAQMTPIINFGENVAMAFLSPEYYERYCRPWYEKRAGQLKAAGIFTHIHIDGYFKPLLPYLATMPFDGLEALTPKPQGDVTLEEMRDNIGDKVLLDGIPAVLFLDHHSRAELKECVEKIVEYFHPRLVLGVSDELPEGGGEEAFLRMKLVAEFCRTREWS